MTRSLQLPDLRRILDGLERRLGILERRIRPQAETPNGHIHDGDGVNSIVVNGNTTDPPAEAAGADGIAIGVAAFAGESVSVAIGSFAQATDIGAIALGDSAAADNNNALALGSSSSASGDSSVAVGDGANTSATNATAVGMNATADEIDATALGSSTDADAVGATAVGSNSAAHAQGSTAVGYDSEASHQNATALGYNVGTSGADQVNIGQNRFFQGTPNSATTDGQLSPNQLSFYLDEGSNLLKGRARYSDETLHTFQMGTGTPVSDHDSLTGVSANDHHNQAHVVDGADHTASGLTSGHVMRATGATTFAFGALQDGDVPATIARDSEVAAAVTAHEAAGDPHTGYATDADLTTHAATPHGGAHPDLATHDTLGLATQAELDAHHIDTTSVHGIADTSVLATDAEVATAVSDHAALADPHTGYQKESEKDQNSGYVGLAAAQGTRDGTKFLRDDGTWAAAGGSHPDLATHDTLGLATQAELDTHAAAADPHTGYLKESVVSGMAAPTIALGATAAAGVATTVISSDATIDAFDTTAPNVIEPDDAAAVGVINFAARRDHEHGIVTAVAGASTFADAAAEGSATSFARSDHKHSREANPVTAHEAAGDPHTGYLAESVVSGLATPAIVLGTAAAAGTGTTPIRHNSTIAAFDATVPTTSGVANAAATGSAAFAARRDHVHGREAFAAPSDTGDANAEGAATTVSRSDHTHKGVVANDAWTSYTPTLTQGVAVTKTVTYAKYQRVGRTIIVSMRLVITSAGTAGSVLLAGLPIAAADASGVVGSFRYFDAGNTNFAGTACGSTTTTVQFIVSSNGGSFGALPAITAANTDVLQVSVTYEAAS